MNAYQFRTAVNGIMRERWINTLSVLAIATGLLMTAMAYLAVYNIKLAAEHLPERFSVTVFLNDTLTEPEGRELVNQVSRIEGVKHVTYISRDEALAELKRTMADADMILGGLAENPLPASLDVRVNEDSVTAEAVRAVADGIKRLKGVSDVEYGEKLLGVIQKVRYYAGTFASAVMLIIVAGMLFVCYSTVKILLYRKRDEVDTLMVLGATKWFIRGPFIIEGGIVGCLGGAIAAVGLMAFKVVVYDQMMSTMPLLSELSAPPEILLALPLGGLLVGALGALMAVGAIKY